MLPTTSIIKLISEEMNMQSNKTARWKPWAALWYVERSESGGSHQWSPSGRSAWGNPGPVAGRAAGASRKMLPTTSIIKLISEEMNMQSNKTVLRLYKKTLPFMGNLWYINFKIPPSRWACCWSISEKRWTETGHIFLNRTNPAAMIIHMNGSTYHNAAHGFHQAGCP